MRRNGFLCYAHNGGASPSRRFVGELQKHLNPLEPKHEHHAWSDQDIRDGADWPAEVRQALDQAAYAVLFINADFFNSAFVQQVELPALLGAAQRDGLLLLALRVGYCVLPDWIARIQFSNHDDKPLSALLPHARDQIYTAVAERVEEHLSGTGAQPQSVRLMGVAPALKVSEAPRVLLEASPDAAAGQGLDLADALSRHVAEKLEDLRERFRGGERKAAQDALQALLDAPEWPALNPALQGRMLRTAAMYRLVVQDDVDGAKELALRAQRCDPDGDGQVLAAHIALRSQDSDGALRLLEAPRSLEARHLKAAMLIEEGHAAAALKALELTPGEAATDAKPNTETWRLRALALLTLRRLPDAADAIAQAKAMSPGWLAVRSVSAIIMFWQACTPAALAVSDKPLWPMPFSRAFVRKDAGARERLEEAAQALSGVASDLREGSREWGHWQTWRLICLLAAGDPADEVSALASRLLSGEGDLHLWPLVWALHFHLDFDRGELKRRLRGATSDDEDFLIQRSLWVEMALADGEVSDVLGDLASLQPALAATGQLDILHQWQVLALASAGQMEEARGVADAIADDRVRLRLNLQIVRALERTTPGSLVAALDALLASDPAPDILAEACEAHAEAGDWSFVAEHADELLAAIPTPTTVRLLVTAAWNMGEYGRCLKALDDQRHLYPNGRLPTDLAVLRVRCQRALGEASQAAREARLLLDQDPSPEHWAELLNAQLETADRTGILESLRRLMLIDGADGELLLKGAHIALQLDRGLAVALWRQAVAKGSERVDFPAQAVLLGANLGIGDDETAPWFQRMVEQAAAGHADVRMLHVAQLPAVMRAHQESSQRVLDALRHGEAPSQALPAGVLPPLPALLHAVPEDNRADPVPLRQWPMLIRHGARPLGLPQLKRNQRPRLILDLTALVTAHSLELLGNIERAFGPLWLQRHWHLVLRSEIDRLQAAQPRQAAAHELLGQLVRAGAIRLLDIDEAQAPPESLSELVGERLAKELEWVRANGARLLTYVPLHGPNLEDWKEIELPEQWSDIVLGPRDLLDGVLEEGLISADEQRRAVASFPQPSEDQRATAIPPRGGALLTNTTLLSQFVDLDLLVMLAHRFRLVVPRDEWESDDQQARQRVRHQEIADWTESLIDRVSKGLESGSYRLLPSPEPTSNEDQPQLNGLGDLLSHRGEPGDLLWVDDRFVNGFPGTGTTPIVGVVEVLDLLRTHGAISEERRMEALYRLRAANCRFIPLGAREILHWLRRAHVDAGRLMVPRQLDVLARYWTACLYQGDGLRWKRDDRHPSGEIPFFVSSQSAVTKALCEIWRDFQMRVDRRRSRADWILENLYVGVGDIAHLVPGSGPQRDMNLVGMDQAGLCFVAFQIMLGQPERRGKQKKDVALNAAREYLRWACERIVLPRFRADPESVAPTATAFRDLLIGALSENDERIMRLFGWWLKEFMPVLPPVLREELHKDQDLMQQLGLTEVTVAEVAGLRIAAEDLWPSVQAALRGRVPIVRAIDQDKQITMRRVSADDDPLPLLELGDAEGKTIATHYFELSELLLERPERRLQALRAHPQWWDGQPDGYEELERFLADIESAGARVSRLGQIAAQSADYHYVALEKELREGRGITVDRCLPPPLDAVLTYVRCAEGRDAQAPDPKRRWQALAASVPIERGLAERLRRVALVPSALPDEVGQALRALDPPEIELVLTRLSAGLHDPVGRLHLLDMALMVANVSPAALGIAQQQIDHFATAQLEAEVQVTLKLVDMAYRVFDGVATACQRPASLRLLAAWAHASRIAGLLLAGGADPAQLAKLLSESTPLPPQDLYARTTEPLLDLAWPWHVNAADLAIVGVGSVLHRHADLVQQLDLTAARDRLDSFLSGTPVMPSDIHLLRVPEVLTDQLRCLWGGDRATHFASLTDSEHAALFSAAAAADRLMGLVEELEVAPDHAYTWHMLWLHVGPGRLPEELAHRLDAVLQGLEFERLIASEPHVLLPLMELAVRHAGDRERVVDYVLDLAADIDAGFTKWPKVADELSGDTRFGLTDRLIHWAHSLAVRHPDDPDGEFARLLEALIMRSRTVAARLRESLTNIARTLPYSRHRTLRRSLLCARSRPIPETADANTAVERKHGRS